MLLTLIPIPKALGDAHPPDWLPRVISRSAGDAVEPYTMRLVVAADKGFVATHGIDWRTEASSLASSAAGLMHDVGLGLTVITVTQWESHSTRLPDMVEDVVAQLGKPRDAVLIALTTQSSDVAPGYDGWAAGSSPVIVIKVGEPTPVTLPSLIAHELGHMLGLDEHEIDCTDPGCLMEGHGYRYGDRWCAHHAAAVASALLQVN